MATPNSKRQKLDEDKLEAIRIPEDVIGEIPEDVIGEILVRLRTQSIPRLQLTCKSWYALIRSRSLIELHRRFHRHDDHQNQLFFYDDQSEHNCHVDAMNSSSFQSTPVFEIENLLSALKSVTPAKFQETLTRVAGIDLPLEMIAEVFEPHINVLGPLSNGIFCAVAQVYARTGDLKTTYGYSNAAFCNPVTGEFQLISTPHVFKHSIEPTRGFLVFDDDVPPAIARKVYARLVLEVKQHYGFGSIIGKGTMGGVVVDYKMVMIIQYPLKFLPRKRYPNWFKVFVYSHRHGVWKLICDSESSSSPWRYQFKFPTITQDLDFLPQAILNGTLCHWMTDEHSILRFDLASEVFGLIPGPPDDYSNHPPPLVKRPGVFVLNDHLAAIIIRYGFALFNNDCGIDVDVWVMKEYGVKESWTKIESCTFQLGLRLQKFLGMFFSGDISHGSIAIERMFFQIKQRELLSFDCFGRIVTKHSISSGRVLKKDSTASRLRKLYDDDDDDDGGGGGGNGGVADNGCRRIWNSLKRKLANEGYDRSLTCWKTIGLSAYVETLEPVALECIRDMDEDDDTRQLGNNRNAI